MEKTTAELTEEYIKEHPFIKSCLKKNIINYSSLSRLIAKELNIEKKSSKEAILIAARRFKESLSPSYEPTIKKVLEGSELEIKNKIISYTLEKTITIESIQELQKQNV